MNPKIIRILEREKIVPMKKLESILFNINLPDRKAYQGSLLIAEPFLRECYFNHAVISLIEYNPSGTSMGLVLNKQTNYNLSDLISNVSRPDAIPVYCGGPMSCDRMYVVHRLGDIVPGSRLIANGLYVGGDFEMLVDYVNSDMPLEGYVRFCLGYSGWGAGQLDEELRKKVWAVASVSDTENLLAGSEDAYWHRQVKQMGRDYRGWLYHPQNPRMN